MLLTFIFLDVGSYLEMSPSLSQNSTLQNKLHCFETLFLYGSWENPADTSETILTHFDSQHYPRLMFETKLELLPAKNEEN